MLGSLAVIQSGRKENALFFGMLCLVFFIYLFYEPLKFGTGFITEIRYVQLFLTGCLGLAGVHYAVKERQRLSTMDCCMIVFLLHNFFLGLVLYYVTDDFLQFYKLFGTYGWPVFLYLFLSFGVNVVQSNKIIKYMAYCLCLFSICNIYLSLKIDIWYLLHPSSWGRRTYDGMHWMNAYNHYIRVSSHGLTPHSDSGRITIAGINVYRISGFGGYMHVTAYFALIGFFINHHLFRHTKNYAYVVGFIACFISLIFTFNKMTFIAFVLGYLIYSQFIKRSEHRRQQIIFKVMIFSALVLLLILAYAGGHDLDLSSNQTERMVVLSQIIGAIPRFLTSYHLNIFNIFFGLGIDTASDAAFMALIFRYGLLGCIIFLYFYFNMLKSIMKTRRDQGDLFEKLFVLLLISSLGYFCLLHRDAILHVQSWSFACIIFGLFSVYEKSFRMSHDVQYKTP